MKKILLILLIGSIGFSQETIQDLINKGIHSSFKIDNSYQIRHFKNPEYQIIISQKNNKIQLGIWDKNDKLSNTPIKIFKNVKKIYDGRLGAYKIYLHDVIDTFDAFGNFIEIFDDGGTGIDGWYLNLNIYYFSSRLPTINKIYDYDYQSKIEKLGTKKKSIKFNYVWYYSGCSG